MIQRLRLKPNADRRLKAGHLWLYSNEIDVQATPLKSIKPGARAVVEAANGKPMGIAYVNPNSLICARVVTRNPDLRLDRSLLVHRFNQALGLRKRLFDKPYYRMINSEGDLLPGLIIDRFDDVLVVRLNTLGMELAGQDVIEALDQVLSPRVIVFKNDSTGRRREQLEAKVEVVKGELTEPVIVEENGVRFSVPVLDGKRTGWFFDHRSNRAWLNAFVKDKRVLDVYSYTGSWGVQAATHGASQVLCIDNDAQALNGARENAALNDVEDRVSVLEEDAFEALAALKTEGERFDVVILDPPPFIRRRKDVTRGERAYGQLNREAIRLLSNDSLLLSASSSLHLSMDRLTECVRGALRHQDRNGQIIFQGHQGPDHPIHPAIPETAYLKALGVRVFRD
ncbi:class I SAM-dependent rRNA methyltransferase [Pistricoccus aurantiacus]|uniref:class I SAM-dependent rRNA methyltransferase n=1 Tax=Pistricoccus aurantiacus TaxID=1883414 RepID=UPI00362F1EEE